MHLEVKTGLALVAAAGLIAVTVPAAQAEDWVRKPDTSSRATSITNYRSVVGPGGLQLPRGHVWAGNRIFR